MGEFVYWCEAGKEAPGLRPVEAAGYLREPYSRVITPNKESGIYTAQILEFPGCIAEGDTIQEAYERLEAAALSWIQAATDLGQEVPRPALVKASCSWDEHMKRQGEGITRSLRKIWIEALYPGQKDEPLAQ